MNRSQIAAAIELGRQEVAGGSLVEVPQGFGRSPAKGYRSGIFTFETQPWVVCTAPMFSSSFNLLDATVRQRLEKKTAHAVALLGARPDHDGHGPDPSPEYLAKYQDVAWSALGVAWALESGELRGKFLATPRGPGSASHGDFSDFAASIKSKLAGVRLNPIPENSRAAEACIRPLVQAALRDVDPSFEPEPSTRYTGFWRRPQADAIWRRREGLPATFALEVKLYEDGNNPLCQALEVLGHVDAMVYVRVVRDGHKRDSPPFVEDAKHLLECGAPMRYLTVTAG